MIFPLSYYIGLRGEIMFKIKCIIDYIFNYILLLIKVSIVAGFVLIILDCIDKNDGICFASTFNIDKLIKEKIDTTINSISVPSYFLNTCPDSSSLLSKLGKDYIEITNPSYGFTHVYVSNNLKKDNLFIIYTSLKIGSSTDNCNKTCILSTLTQKDAQLISFGSEDKLKSKKIADSLTIDRKILKDSSFIKVDTSIKHQIKNYQIQIYHGVSLVPYPEFKDKIISSISKDYKNINQSFNDKKVDKFYHLLLVKSDQVGHKDNALFVDINKTRSNTGEISIYEISNR